MRRQVKIGFQRLITILASIGCLAGCGLHLIGKRDIPTALQSLHLHMPDSNAYFSQTIQRQLATRGFSFRDSAPYTLTITHIRYRHPFPDAINAGQAFNTQATLSVAAALSRTNGSTIWGPITLTEKETLLHNANQLNTSSLDPLFKRLLTERIVKKLTAYLTAKQQLTRLKQGSHHAHQRP